ncbi:hypothetical protein LTR08_007183 [Meristemomyces frigidus]|nr:hypothetical protein LTR08_007183 [Meristemomyces frigidus]
MADHTPPRQMSLIPYPNDREVVLRRGNAVVVYDTRSQQLQLRATSDQSVEITECPLCHRPYHDDATRDSEDHGPSFSPERPFVDPEYFGMLAANHRGTPTASGTATPSRWFVPAALRSGRSRDVSWSTGPPMGGGTAGDSPSGPRAEGISSSAFNPGFFKQTFVERGLLGRGGNGVVLLVEHVMDRVSLGQFACKRVPVGNNHSWLEKVLVEVRVLQRMPHRHLANYHFVWLEDHQPTTFGPSIPCLWILQDYCEGGDLQKYVLGPSMTKGPSTAEKLKERHRRRSKSSPEPPTYLHGPSRLTFDEIFSFFRDITTGLHHLHAHGYLHRDMKPSNCLLQRDGTKMRALISDFGEVQAAGAKRVATGATGTISYCAPEVLQRETPDGTFGDFTVKSDIFSLGMIVYFMCFARLPYVNADGIDEEAEDLDELRAEIVDWPGFDDKTRSRPDLPEKLYRFLKRLLSVDPNERPNTGDILDSIKGGGSLNEDEATPRVSVVASPSRQSSSGGRRHSTHVSRPGLLTTSRQNSSEIAQSQSPKQSTTDGRNENGDRPMNPVEGAVALRPRKIELPAPADAPAPQQSPRLMLQPPPPPPYRGTSLWRVLHFAQRPTTISGFRVGLFVAKVLMLCLPCAPYATNAWLLYSLLGLAGLDLGLMAFDLRRSLLLAGVHLVAVVLASQRGRLCERPAMVWRTSDPNE